MAYVRCKWLMANHVRAIRSNDAFPCSWPEPPRVLPVSVRLAYGFSDKMPKRNVAKQDCAVCPCFEARETKPTDAQGGM
jgi:hypothetical protein